MQGDCSIHRHVTKTPNATLFYYNKSGPTKLPKFQGQQCKQAPTPKPTTSALNAENPSNHRQPVPATEATFAAARALLRDPKNLKGVSTKPKDEPAESGYTLWSPSQFLSHEPPEGTFMLGDGYVEAGAWTSLVGIGGLGKSRLALWLAVSILTGRQWCGLETTQRAERCIIFCTENGLRRWKNDLQSVRSVLSPEEWQIIEENLRLLALTDDEDGSMLLSDDRTRTKLHLSLDESPAALLVFDPLADMNIGDESRTADMVETIRILRDVIRRTQSRKAAVVLVHHARTGASNVAQAGDNFAAGNFGRGAKALYSAVRCELQLAPADKDDPDKIVLACGKANDTQKFKIRGLIFNGTSYGVDPEFDVKAWRADVNGQHPNATGPSVLDVARCVKELCPYSTSPPAKKGEIDKAMGVEDEVTCRKTVGNKLRKAIDLGYVAKGTIQGEYRLGRKPIPDA